MEKIVNYMAESLLSIGATASILEATHSMHNNKIHSLLVEESGEYIGIITNNDISKKVVSGDLDPEKVKVADVMSFPLIKLESQESMERAAQVMRDHGTHHLVVMEHGQMLGILSITDYHNYLVKKHPR
ncbi:MAG: CBS domain-containing protein [Nitrospina sp.]|nr:CBS domain-containing protein [Nitrospina sp.]MBT3509519.1 CBS domain-containing protein [Nitrospina sp.]MBT3877072.1 CBS domain-containing protein [Nitrospina sp.]MBT4050049.1 CBS domain-containing protein [Nitrospina sp.]MBT4558209.1 CBS domain-containing protein [Nitrospina sp.]